MVAHTTLVDTGTLAAHLDDGWAILDCRSDLTDEGWGRAQYLQSHIPGAVHVSLAQDLSATRDGRNGRHPLPTPDAMAALFGRLGVGAATQAVIYDQDSGMYASRLWWMLRYMGHDAAAVLDGGWAKWTGEARPVRGGDERRASTSFVAHPDPARGVTAEEVAALVHRDDALLVDARAPERFEGRSEPIDRVAGHIPGAVNHFFKTNVTVDGTMLPPDILRARFEALLDGRSSRDVVMYCGSGVTACQNLLAMAHAGLDGARLYPGSWSEWSSDPERPGETGPARENRGTS